MINKKKKRRLIHIILGATIILVILFVLNYYLAKRLEIFLKKELVERTSNATNGFYTLAFDSLSISLLNGELRMQGISLYPNPEIFKEWQDKDSLPPVYVDTKIDLIDFKGINLIWRRNYKHLHFQTFEIRKPIVKVIQAQLNDQEETDQKNLQTKTLYELVSPYINVLSVKTMNLENASIFYDVKDKEFPIHYQLDDASFHAYGFRLDEDSHNNGKLLYCDDFDFTTNQKQTLLTNNNFIFSTDSISLDTKKKEVFIGNTNLTPQEKLWEQGIPRPDNIIDGHIEAIRIDGIEFIRKEGLNSLVAGSFQVIHPDVTGASIIRQDSVAGQHTSAEEDQYINADALIRKMSLYDIVSPIFHDITINSIGVRNAKLHYTTIINGLADVYSLNNFNFETRGFVIDSLSSLSDPSRYYKYISLEATDMKGTITSRNQTVDLKRISMNTEDELLYIEKLNLGIITPQKQDNLFSGKVDTVSLQGVNYINGVNARLFSISGVDLDYYLAPDTIIGLQMPKLALSGLSFDTRGTDPVIRMENLYMGSSNIRLRKTSQPALTRDIQFNHLDIKNFSWDKNNYKVDSIDMKMDHLYTIQNGKLQKQINDTVSLSASGLVTDSKFKKYKVNNINFNASNLSIPVDDGFFTLNIGRIALNNRDLSVDKVHYVSAYPQLEFSYKHPKHSDWFDIKVDRLEMKGINIPDLFEENTLRMKEATVNNMTLQNMRNQKLSLPHNIVPMIYEGIQKAPLKLDIPLLHVNNFAVAYYEWAKNGETPGKLSITDVTGTVTGLTNIATQPEQFMRIDADAKFMGTGDFSAIWLIPVDPKHDQFMIHAHLKSFNLPDLNAFITPLAGAKVESGYVQDMTFDMDASSKEGTILLRLPYRDLKVDLGKLENGELNKNGFTSWLVNAAVRNNNPPHPDKPDSELRESRLTITRDPYHSTFNYLWQMLSPALAESVGISEGTQKFGKGVAKTIKSIKNFFTGNKDKKESEKDK